jgi:hypothetical protein
MDVYRIIRELVVERDRLQRIIESLEEMVPNVREQARRPETKRRGRKSMDRAARDEVSERMKRYWAQRKAARSTHAKSKNDDANSNSA